MNLVEGLNAAMSDPECPPHFGPLLLAARNAVDEIERLRAALKECADGLTEQVEYYYDRTKDHPAMKRRYDRDMQPVLDARAALNIQHPTGKCDD